MKNVSGPILVMTLARTVWSFPLTARGEQHIKVLASGGPEGSTGKTVRIRHSPAAVCGYEGDRRSEGRADRKATRENPRKALPEVGSRRVRNRAGCPEQRVASKHTEWEAPFDAFAGRIGGSTAIPEYRCGRRFSARLP
jgi:hypothetical protein